MLVANFISVVSCFEKFVSANFYEVFSFQLLKTIFNCIFKLSYLWCYLFFLNILVKIARLNDLRLECYSELNCVIFWNTLYSLLYY